MVCVVGIDPSLTGFAACAAYTPPAQPHTPSTGQLKLREGEWSSKPAKAVQARVARYRSLIRELVNDWLWAGEIPKPDLVLIEGYAFQARTGRMFDRAELGGVLRHSLCEAVSCPIIEPSPKTVKMWLTGFGTAAKRDMMAATGRKHSDNAADAYALCDLGLHLIGAKVDEAKKAYLVEIKRQVGLT